MRAQALRLLLLVAVALPATTAANEIPLDGYLPMVGMALTDEFDEDFNFFPFPSTSPSGTFLGHGGAHYDIALLDTGAGFSLLTSQAYDDFNLDGPYPGENDGFFGTEVITVGGATGQINVRINDPYGLYVGGLQGRASAGASFAMSTSALTGQTNMSTVTFPAESDLPNVVGLPFAGQYATRIRSDSPQVFEMNGRTVRTPAIDFLPLGSGGAGITRKAPLLLNPGASFVQPPAYLPNIANFDINNPEENPTAPTLTQGALFVNATVSNDASSLGNKEFFFDTGASVTVVSEFNALLLGFDVTLDEPEFTIPVVGSGGTLQDVPGFFVDEITLPALGGSVTANNVPVLVLDVTDPSDAGNIVEGIIGTNLFTGRNIVIDPNPSVGGGGNSAGLYISDPVTTEYVWTTTSHTAGWSSAAPWDEASAPDLLSTTTLHAQQGYSQEAHVVGQAEAWSVRVAGETGANMTVRIEEESKLTVFSGTRLEAGAIVQFDGGVLDTQYLDIRGGVLSGDGLIRTGSGPIEGQVEVISGLVDPGDGVGALEIEGRLSLRGGAEVRLELGGTESGDYDQLWVDGAVALGGALSVEFTGGFFPQENDAFELITHTGQGGAFDTINLPSGVQWRLDHNQTSLLLVAVSIDALPGDANGDGRVDILDLDALSGNYGTTAGATLSQGDFNADGAVDILDLDILSANYGSSLGAATSASAAIPEPSAGLALFLTLALSTRATRRTAIL